MGKLFDELNNIDTENPINKYLKKRGFFVDTMNPRFMNGNGYDELSIGKKCLEYVGTINNDKVLRIFINTTDIYFELETSYRSYECARRYDPKEFTTVKDIEILLDEILKQVLD